MTEWHNRSIVGLEIMGTEDAVSKHVVIIGNGIAGITAARGIRKLSDHRVTVISAESAHFFSRPALMYIYMGHMRFEDIKPYEDHFWAANRIELLNGRVERVDCGRKRLELQGGDTLDYDVLVIASGSRSNRFGWPGQNLIGVQGLVSLQDLEALERNTRGIDRGVVVGGGLIGVEMAEMLASRGIPVSFLVREIAWMDFAFPPAESRMIEQEIRAHGIDLRMGTELAEVLGDDAGRVRAVRTTWGEEIPCQIAGLTVGVSPNIDFLDGSEVECGRGVLVDGRLRTSVADIFAIGDCAELRRPKPGRGAVEALWYIGRAMGEAVAHTICGDDTPYEQDLWFNSAKFFDLEWQVYGDVPAVTQEGVESLVWQDERRPLSIRINFEGPDGPVLGFNLMGIRYRHEVCDRWLRRRATIREVLADLGAANFDPELFAQHEGELVAAYNRDHPRHAVRLRRRRGLRGVLDLLRAS